jgi:hypothetical protein
MEPEKDIFEQWKEEKENRPFYKKWYDSIRLWWKFDGRYILRNIKESFKNIRYWLPIIWKDRHWDHSYIFYILEHKLKAQAHRLHTSNMHLSAKRDAEIIRTCIRLIGKVNEEYYLMEYLDYHKDKHWFEPVEGNPNLSTWKTRQLEENFDDYFAKYPLIYKRVLNGEGPYKINDKKNKGAIARGIGYLNHQRARKLLFKIMEKNIENWWD